MGIKINYTGKGFIHPITKQYIAPGYGFEEFSILDIENPNKSKNIKNIGNIIENKNQQKVLKEDFEYTDKTTINDEKSNTKDNSITKKVKKVKKS